MATDNLYTMVLDPETDKSLTLCLFSKVQNATELRKLLMSGKLQCCLIKAPLIYDPFQVTVAANKSVLREKYSKLITKSVYTEILYNLSLTKNISQSLTNFGINDSDKEVLVALIHEQNPKVSTMKTILDVIEGQSEPIENLNELRDIGKIKKLYKIDDAELKVSRLLDSIVSRVSVKDFISIK